MFIELFNFSFFSITGVEKEKKMYGEPPLPFYQLTEVRQFLLSSTDQSFYMFRTRKRFRNTYKHQ